LGAASAAGLFLWVTADMPSRDDILNARESKSVVFLDRDRRVIKRLEAQGAPPVAIDSLPPHVGQAVLAIEDKRFYDHHGVDLEGLSRALMTNFREGRVVQGGSTITQQLAKNLFLTNERTLWRKVQEAAWAVRLELLFEKDEILALYMSRVFFGAGAYGIESASERYFDKPATKLSLGESALLAGLLKAPSRMNPAVDDTNAKLRAEVVLNEMVAQAYITSEQRDEAVAAPLPIRRRSPVGNFGYFSDWIAPQLDAIIGDDPDTDLVVETTLDVEAQRAGEQAIAKSLEENGDAMRVSQAALVSMDRFGAVRSMVGGSGYGATQFNRATQARRQPGSAFKYFIYLAAMQDENYSPWTVKVDKPIVIGDWAPGNYKDKYYGPVQLVSAFARSLNMVAIDLANDVGGDRVIDTARRLGVRTKLHNYRSLALGAQELPLIEMTQAYAAMTADGHPVTPYGIQRVRNARGEILYEWRRPQTEQVVDDRALRSMNLLLNRVVEGGTGTRAKIEGRQIGGKTGTGNDYRDAWFIGFTSGITTGVWVGNDEFKETNRVTGGSMPADIWREFMLVALRNVEPEPLVLADPADYAPEPSPEDYVDPYAAFEPPPAHIIGAPLMTITSAPDGPVPSSLIDSPEG
jgi:penicillin-binding protein 1A